MSGLVQGPLAADDEEDFGGFLPPVVVAIVVRRKTRAELRADKFARGECRDCSRPVLVRPDGRRLRLCETHARADRDRKPKKGPGDAT